MPNAGKYFLSSFNQAYNRASQDYEQEQRAKNVLDREEALQNYKNKLSEDEANKENALIEPLIKGKISDLGLSYKPSDFVKTNKPFNLQNMENQYQETSPRAQLQQIERPITAEDKINNLLELSKTKGGIEKYTKLKELTGNEEGYNKISNLFGLGTESANKNLAPNVKEKAQQTLQAGKMLGLPPKEVYKTIDSIINPEIKEVQHNAYDETTIYKNGTTKVTPTKGLNPAYKTKTWHETLIPNSLYKDTKTGKFYKKIGYKDLDAGIWNKDEKGNYTVAKEQPISLLKTGTNGEKIFSNEITKDFNDYKSSMQKTLGDIGTTDSDLQDIETKLQDKNLLSADKEKLLKNKESLLVEKNTNKKDLYDTTSAYSSEVVNTASSRVKNWYKDIYNADKIGKVKKNPKSNPQPIDFWNSVLEKIKKGEFTHKDQQSAYHLFQSTYYANPLKLYGTNDLESITGDSDNENPEDIQNPEEQ